jgi:2-(3-amino-3-carboxypropyl)histidine synthase
MISKAVLSRLRKTGASRVLVQVPEGLKMRAGDIVKEAETAGFQAVLSVEPCYGACDVADAEAKRLSCGAVLHIGHSDFGKKTAVPVVYDEWAQAFDPRPLLRKNFERIGKFRSFGLLASVQYLPSLRMAREFLLKKKKKVFVGKARNLHPGQVLGCNYATAAAVENDVDCFIFIGSGHFHSDGLLAASGKPVFFLNAEERTLSLFAQEYGKPHVKRALRIEKARGLSRFAVFVSTKPGQCDIRSAMAVKESLSKKGKQAFVITAGAISPEKIMGMGIQVIVNTACPRIKDDGRALGALVLSAEEALEI